MHDAHIVLEAVRLHKLQPVTRRLNEVEVSTYSIGGRCNIELTTIDVPQRMSFIRSGSVFVWEESDDDTGLRRWTDGLLWSASRMREVGYISSRYPSQIIHRHIPQPFLFYETRTVIPRSAV